MHISKSDILYSHVHHAATKWQVSDISRMSNFKSACIMQNATLLYSIHCHVCHHDNIQYFYLYNCNTVCVWWWPHMPRLEIRLGKEPESISWTLSQKLQLTFLALSRLSVDLKIQVLFIRIKGTMMVKKGMSQGENIKVRALVSCIEDKWLLTVVTSTLQLKTCRKM